MSVLPYNLYHRRGWWDTAFESPFRIFDQHFGLPLHEDQLFPPQLRHGDYPGVPRRSLSRNESGVSEVTNTADAFTVNLQVSHFKPEELSVSVIDNHVVVRGKHEEKDDDEEGHQRGYISRQFQRRYVLPANAKPEQVVSELSADGQLLKIVAPKHPEAAALTRSVPIGRSEPPSPAVTEDKPSGSNK